MIESRKATLFCIMVFGVDFYSTEMFKLSAAQCFINFEG